MLQEQLANHMQKYKFGKKKVWMPTSHQIQKLTQNELWN